MDTFLELLSSNHLLTTTLVLSFGIIVTALVIMYLFAFFQGRSISFWPPKIGEKPITPVSPRSDKETDSAAYRPETIEIPETKERVGTGWLMPTPDTRDLNVNDESIIPIKERLGLYSNKKGISLPGMVDLRTWCPEIRNQGRLNSGTAHAALALFEYHQRRAFDRYIDLSRRFVYYNARKLMHLKGDSGATLRHTLQAITLFGSPLEEDWPYTDEKSDIDNEPPASLYAMGYNYHAVRYFCHDPIHISMSPADVLRNVKSFLAAGIPSVFGFFIFPSFPKANIKGALPYPCVGERYKWKHAALAVGYDDTMKVENLMCKRVTKGALLIHNSWGSDWGDNGYGWLPYEYVYNKQALDFWSIMTAEWISTGRFGR